MPTGVSLFVWLPEERARWVEMRAKRDRAIRAMFGPMSADLDQAQAEGVELSHRCDNRRHRQQTVAVSHRTRIGHKIC